MLGMDFSRLRSLVESTYGLGLGSGRVFFVGTSTDRWFTEELTNAKLDGTVRTTVDSALGACEAGRGDVVVVLPGRHTLTGAPAMPNATRLVGIPGMREATTVLSKTATNGISMSGNDCLVQGITFKVEPSKHGITITGLNNSVKDCAFRHVSGTPTSYLQVDGQSGSKGVGTRISDCFFSSDATTAIQLSSDGNDQIDDVMIVGCHIAGATNGVLLPAHNCESIYITDNVFAASTNPINVTAGKTGTGSVISGNSFGVATTDDCTNNALPASYFWARNYTRAGLSGANPA